MDAFAVQKATLCSKLSMDKSPLATISRQKKKYPKHRKFFLICCKNNLKGSTKVLLEEPNPGRDLWLSKHSSLSIAQILLRARASESCHRPLDKAAPLASEFLRGAALGAWECRLHSICPLLGSFVVSGKITNSKQNLSFLYIQNENTVVPLKCITGPNVSTFRNIVFYMNCMVYNCILCKVDVGNSL